LITETDLGMIIPQGDDAKTVAGYKKLVKEKTVEMFEREFYSEEYKAKALKSLQTKFGDDRIPLNMNAVEINVNWNRICLGSGLCKSFCIREVNVIRSYVKNV